MPLGVIRICLFFPLRMDEKEVFLYLPGKTSYTCPNSLKAFFTAASEINVGRNIVTNTVLSIPCLNPLFRVSWYEHEIYLSILDFFLKVKF